MSMCNLHIMYFFREYSLRDMVSTIRPGETECLRYF